LVILKSFIYLLNFLKEKVVYNSKTNKKIIKN